MAFLFSAALFCFMGILLHQSSAMKKIYVLAIGLLTLTTSVQSQTAKKTTWGLKLGLNSSNLRIEDGENSECKTGLATGVFVNIKAGNKFSIQPEFLYSSMGGKNLNPAGETSLRLNYFSLPLLAKYNVTSKFSVFAGPQIDVMIIAKTKDQDGFDEVTNDFKENSFNATGGVEFWPIKCLGFSGRYIYGVNNILPNDLMKWKNQGVQVMAAIRL